MDNPCQEITTMKLYLQLGRIYDDLKALGYKEDSKLKVEDVARFDQLHYHGTEAVDKAIQTLGIGPQHTILDVGSGYGGPGRYIAHRTGCKVIGVEMQKELVDIAQDLTDRCGLGDKMQYVHGNFLEMNSDELGQFDFVVSWLVFLHISDKDTLLKRCHECLKTGGKMYIEDFYKRGKFTEDEMIDLNTAVYCKELPRIEDYDQLITNLGFKTQITDMTVSWRAFVASRLEHHYSDNYKENHIKIHGEDTFESQGQFFKAINRCWAGGNLGGAIIVAEKL